LNQKHEQSVEIKGEEVMASVEWFELFKKFSEIE
jgi:hypothetical protein